MEVQGHHLGSIHIDSKMEVSSTEGRSCCQCSRRGTTNNQRQTRGCLSRPWLFTLACLVFVILTVTNTAEAGSSHSRVKRQAPDLKFEDFKDDVGMRKTDLIFILDRSSSMNKQWYYQHIKKMARSLIERFVVVHPKYVRVAFVSFAKDVSVDVDYITKGYNLTKCTLMLTEEAEWHNIFYHTKQQNLVGTNIKDAFLEAGKIFKSPTNPRAGDADTKKVILLITDGDYQAADDPYNEREDLINDGVIIYTIGLGSWYVTGNVRQLASKAEYHGNVTDWKNRAKGATRSPGPEVDPLYVKMSSDMCDSCGAQSNCYCEVFTGDLLCRCPAGMSPGVNDSCEGCTYHSFKDDIGNYPCTSCPSYSGTYGKGAAGYQDCTCFNASDTRCNLADNPCDATTACMGDNTKCVKTFPSHQCVCKHGYEWNAVQLSCMLKKQFCNPMTQDPCVNGHCVELAGEFTCECDTAWRGRLCDININECRHPVCDNGATCLDENNNFRCICPPGFKGYYCNEIVTTTTSTTTTTTTAPPTTTTTPTTTTPTTTTPTTTTPTTTTPTTTTPTTTPASTRNPNSVSAQEEADKRFMIIVAASAAVGVLLLIIIIVIAVCCCCRRKKEPEKTTTTTSTSTGTQSSVRFEKRKPRPSIYKSISQRFSGIWKKKTIRGGMWSDDDNTKTGAPSAPAKRRPDLIASSLTFSDPKSHDLDEIVVSNEEIAQPSGMEGWDAYLEDLQTGQVIKYGVIAHVDGEKVAKSSNYIYKADEIDKAHEILLDQEEGVQLLLQGTTFDMEVNTGDIAIGRSSRTAETEVVLLSHTKKFIVALIAWETATTDMVALEKEVQYIVDHISAEGY